MEIHIPTPVLQPYIKAFHVIESHHAPLENRILPDTTLALAFRFGGRVINGHPREDAAIPAASLAGLRQSARLIRYLPHSGTVVALLKAGTAPAFFQNPLYETKGLTLGLDAFFAASEIARIQDQLSEARDHDTRVAIVEKFLQTKLIPQKPDAVVLHAVAAIRRAKGQLSMAGLANSMFLSQDAFEKRFRRTVGTSPKAFAEIVRLRALIANYQPHQSIQQLALEGDYFDQAHFNHAFKRFTGLPPREFFNQPRFW